MTIHVIIILTLFRMSMVSNQLTKYFNYYIQSVIVMISKISFLALVTYFGLLLAFSQCSVVIKTRTYESISYSSAPAGLSYPEHVNIIGNQMSTLIILLQFYNFTSQQTTLPPITFHKDFKSICQFAMQTIDYGYYTKFPFYRLIGECSNSTHQQMSVIEVFRSGDVNIKKNPIVEKTIDEINCNEGPLRVQYFYSASGSASTFLYKFCLKKSSGTQSIYKQYKFQTKSPYIFKEQSIQKNLGLNNITLVDFIPSVGLDGSANLYLTQSNGIIVNNGNKFTQLVWKIVGGEKPYKIEKLCWSDRYALLTEGYIYFLNLTFDSNKPTSIGVIRKSDKINIDTRNCSFFTIGSFAICSIYDQTHNETTWYIYGDDAKIVATNLTQKFAGNFKPYISTDLCSTNSFYQSKSRYQFYVENKVKQADKSKKRLVKLKLPATNGDNKQLSFYDTGILFVSTTTTINQTHKNVTFYQHFKSGFPTNFIVIRTGIYQNNVKVQLQYIFLTPASGYLIAITSENSKNLTTFWKYNKTVFAYNYINSFQLALKTSNIGLINSGPNPDKLIFIAKTSIQKKAIARLTNSIPDQSLDLRYPYQFEADSFQICSIYDTFNQALLYRKDPDSLVVMRAGLRNKNFLALDDVLILKQYKQFSVECAHDGLILYRSSMGLIRVLDNDLQIRYQLKGVQFEDLKITKSLVLLKNGIYVEVRSLQNGQLLAVNKWSLQEIQTNIHSKGFINVKENNYYELGNSVDRKIRMNEI